MWSKMGAGSLHNNIPGFNTVRHSSLVRSSGYDIFSAEGVEVPKKELRNGIEGMDFKTVAARWL